LNKNQNKMADILGTKYDNDVVTKVEPKWRNFEGITKKLSELDHQHLSNIHYFITLMFPKRYDEDIRQMIREEIDKRFDGQLLPYRPLRRFRMEMDRLEARGWLKDSHDGVNPVSIIIFDNKVIGSVDEGFTKV